MEDFRSFHVNRRHVLSCEPKICSSVFTITPSDTTVIEIASGDVRVLLSALRHAVMARYFNLYRYIIIYYV